MKISTLQAVQIAQMRGAVAHEAKRLGNLGLSGSDVNLRATAATISILVHLRNAARLRPLVGGDLQDAIDATLAATGVEEYEGPMGEVLFRYVNEKT